MGCVVAARSEAHRHTQMRTGGKKGDMAMIPFQRHKALMELLRAHGVLSTKVLTDELGVSHMTVRRDIARLEADGLVESVVGGVRLADAGGDQPPTGRRQRAELQIAAKQSIAAEAAARIVDGMTVFLDAGTTCEAIVPHLARREHLTVVTNDLYSAVALLDHSQVEVVHVGGGVDAESGSTTGALAIRMFDVLALDLCLLSTGAWSLERGLTVRRSSQLALKQSAMAVSRCSVLLADASKYGASASYRVVGLADLDEVITDGRLDETTKGLLETADVAVSLAGR